jgi:hypothetical protein
MSIWSWIRARFSSEARIRRLRVLEEAAELAAPIATLVGHPEISAGAKVIAVTADKIADNIEEKQKEEDLARISK